jgi:hypothetical protein
MNTEWEYKIVIEKAYNEAYLNHLGKEKWELIGIVNPFGNIFRGPMLYFKRRKE